MVNSLTYTIYRIITLIMYNKGLNIAYTAKANMEVIKS
jgi:hypothetical protein